MTEPQLIDPDTIDLTSTVAPTDTLSTVELDGETVIYDDSNGSIHLLDPIATVVWSVLDGTSSLEEIAADLAEAFGADPAQVRSDIVTLVRNLGHSGLLAGVQGDGSASPVPDQGQARDDC